jgi:LuxR family maltose regulon positive regulatory protein
LIERLDATLKYPLTLISAPAGSGKTSALSAWIAHSTSSIAWLSLDKGDNDPTRFWTYVIAALQRLRPAFGKDAHALLQAQDQQSHPIEAVLTLLLNEIAAFPDTASTYATSSEHASLRANVALVLDDYHVIDTPAIHAGIAFLLDHLPSQMHLIIASRTDPPLPLARLRAGLSNRAIAQQLCLSVATVKVHLKHIYGKLEVNSRMQAVARARELNLM